MSKVRIVNWILTRKCNLKCDYCAIVRNYEGKPGSYPDMKHYIKNEMPTEVVLETLGKLKVHNPNVFNIFYGGEPLLRLDLAEIINYCNDNEIYYTIISNNTPEVQSALIKLFDKVNHIEGFTSSVDPIFNEPELNKDRVIKSIEGLQRLKELQAADLVKDVVAEITVMKHNQHLLYHLICILSKEEIYSDITFVDIAKSIYYDFSNIRHKNLLVQPTFRLAEELNQIMTDPSLLVHMKDVLIPKMFDTLPSNFDCELEKNLHTICIDSDSTLRLCLRIRGLLTPKITVNNLFNKNKISSNTLEAIKKDKQMLCKLCNHSCYMMGMSIDKKESQCDNLIHFDKRKNYRPS